MNSEYKSKNNDFKQSCVYRDNIHVFKILTNLLNEWETQLVLNKTFDIKDEQCLAKLPICLHQNGNELPIELNKDLDQFNFRVEFQFNLHSFGQNIRPIFQIGSYY